MAGEDLLAYYAQRAHEYEHIYEKPERQSDLGRLRLWLQDALAGHRVLEIACGMGYWTAAVAPFAAAVTATDASSVGGEFTAGLAAFWWSHVPRERQSEFLRSLHRRLGPGAVVVLMDNRLVDGSSTAISRQNAAGNTYQQRRLADGSTHEILKNFPTAVELEAVLSPLARELGIAELVYYWMARYRVASAA
jgi:hypothetical protein